jgi:hypothetical protein
MGLFVVVKSQDRMCAKQGLGVLQGVAFSKSLSFVSTPFFLSSGNQIVKRKSRYRKLFCCTISHRYSVSLFLSCCVSCIYSSLRYRMALALCDEFVFLHVLYLLLLIKLTYSSLPNQDLTTCLPLLFSEWTSIR